MNILMYSVIDEVWLHSSIMSPVSMNRLVNQIEILF